MAARITSDEWLAELQNLTEHTREDDGFLTKREMAKQLGVSITRIDKLIILADDMGMLEVRRITKINRIGIAQPYPAYRVRKKSKR